MCCACTVIVKTILILNNIILMLAGLATIVGATYLVKHFISGDVPRLVEDLPQPAVFDGFLSRWGIADTTQRKGETHNTETLNAIIRIGVNLVSGLGVCLLLLGLIGCVSSSTNSSTCDIVYIVCLVVTISGCLYVQDVFKSGKAVDLLEDKLKEKILPKYKGARFYDFDSLAVNYYMVKLKCCGFTDYTDFEKAPSWERSYILHTKMIVLKAPLACCKLNDSFPEGLPLNEKCLTNPTEANSHFKTGCLSRLSLVTEIRDSVIKYSIFIIVDQVICTLMVMYKMSVQCRSKQDKKKKKHDISRRKSRARGAEERAEVKEEQETQHNSTNWSDYFGWFDTSEAEQPLDEQPLLPAKKRRKITVSSKESANLVVTKESENVQTHRRDRKESVVP